MTDRDLTDRDLTNEGTTPTGTTRTGPSEREGTNTATLSVAQQAFGDFAPAFADFTDDLVFGQLWPRPQLSPRDRSLITVAALTAGGNTEQLPHHLRLARRNGVTEEELIEEITHLAFYAGWPRAFSAMTVAKQVFRGA